jgi:hypothetical protein
MYSGGVTSWATAVRVREQYPEEPILLLFADTKIEDPDLYRFLYESAAEVKEAELVIAAEGRDPWQVFHDVKLLGNSHHDPCSRVLKREFLRKWLTSRYNPPDCIIYLGYDWTEIDRWKKAQRYWDPFQVRCPLMDRPFVTKAEAMEWARDRGVDPPLLNRQGFAHNNCGGFCVKAGLAAFRHLLRVYPERYALHEAAEERWRVAHKKDYAIMRDRSGGEAKPLTMKHFRERIEAGEAEDPQMELDWGGCGCFDP